MDEAWRESVRRTPEQERNMTATFTVGEKDMMQRDMKELTKSYYDETKNGRKIKRWLLPDERESGLMVGIMLNHPSTIWTRQCAENYDYLLELWISLCYECEYRYGK